MIILSPEEQAKIDQQAQDINDLIEYCRAKEHQVKGFGHAFLDDIAKQSGMNDNLKSQIKLCIDDPTKEVKVNFKKNE